MSDDHDTDDLESRLAALGRQPIEPDVRSDHLRRASLAAPEVRRRRFGPVAIAAAALVGFAAGSAGLASAGALPDPAQNLAHDVLGVVRIDVPEGGNRFGPCISEAAKLDDEEAKRAAKEACRADRDADHAPGRSGDAPGHSGDAPGHSGDAPGRSGDAPGRSGDAPGHSGDAPGRSGDAPGHSGDAPGRSGDAPGQMKHADDPCRGRPAWAGPMSKEERAAIKQEMSREGCDDADAEDTDPDDAEELPEP